MPEACFLSDVFVLTPSKDSRVKDDQLWEDSLAIIIPDKGGDKHNNFNDITYMFTTRVIYFICSSSSYTRTLPLLCHIQFLHVLCKSKLGKLVVFFITYLKLKFVGFFFFFLGVSSPEFSKFTQVTFYAYSKPNVKNPCCCRAVCCHSSC